MSSDLGFYYGWPLLGRVFAGCGHGEIPRLAGGRSAARLRCPSPGSSRPT